MEVHGRLVIVEPYLPEDCVEREVLVLGTPLGGPVDLVLLYSEEPIGWDGDTPTRLILVRPRRAEDSYENATLMVNGTTWNPIDPNVNWFIAELTLDSPIGSHLPHP